MQDFMAEAANDVVKDSELYWNIIWSYLSFALLGGWNKSSDLFIISTDTEDTCHGFTKYRNNF